MKLPDETRFTWVHFWWHVETVEFTVYDRWHVVAVVRRFFRSGKLSFRMHLTAHEFTKLPNEISWDEVGLSSLLLTDDTSWQLPEGASGGGQLSFRLHHLILCWAGHIISHLKRHLNYHCTSDTLFMLTLISPMLNKSLIISLNETFFQNRIFHSCRYALFNSR